jgi:hypothetical protein
VPILLSLREFAKRLDIEALITSFLDRECGAINPRFRLFKAMNDAGMFVLILDGFDEMATRVDADTLETNLLEIEKLAAPVESRLILTVRTEFFVSAAEERGALQPKADLLATRNQEYEPIKILPWDEGQIESFISRRVPLIPEAAQPWTYYRDQIRRIPQLAGFSDRPVLLDMIVRTLPELLGSGKPINRPNLYETYLVGEIKRQKILKKRVLLLGEEIRFSIMRTLALKFLAPPSGAFTFSEAKSLIEECAGPPREELEAYTRDFLTCSFLVRDGDAYRFFHRSIMEYLVARALLEEITARQPTYFRRCRLSPVIAGFLSELEPDTATLWVWVHMTRRSSQDDAQYLGGNAVTVLSTLDRSALAGRDLQRTVLIGADLSFCDLRGARLRGATLKEVNLVEGLYEQEDLGEVKLLDGQVSVLMLGSGVTRPSARESRDRVGEWFDRLARALAGTGARPLAGIIHSANGPVASLELHVSGSASIPAAVEALRRSPDVEAAAAFAYDRQRLVERLPHRDRAAAGLDAESVTKRWRRRRGYGPE